MENTYGLTREIMLGILKEVSKRMQVVKKVLIKDYSVGFNRKNLSEIIGKITEKVASEVLTKKLGYEVKRALKDRDPDLTFTKINKPLEIKVTSTDNAWTGGEFSQRPFDFLLISWGGENFNEFFVVLTHLKKNDWKSNISKNFYGPTYTIRKLFDKKDKIFFLGKLIKKGHTIKMVREKVN